MKQQHTIILIAFLVVFLNVGIARAAAPNQSPVQHRESSFDFDFRAQTWYGLNEATSARSNEEAAREYLLRYPDRFGGVESIEELEFISERTSPSGHHLLFRQMVSNIPVYRGEVRVHMDQQRVIKAVTSTVLPVSQLVVTQPAIPAETAIQTAIDRIGEPRPDSQPDTDQLIVIDHESGDGYVVWRVRLSCINPLGDWELLIDALNGDVLYIDNRMAFENGEGLAFDPDPISTAGVEYGEPGYTDDDDADTPELNVERVPVLLRDISFHEGAYWLEGPNVEITDFEAPAITPVSSATLNGFTYTRSESGFEDVNAYYHIDSMQRLIQSLGFTDLQNGPISADPHACNGQDMSYYSPEFNRLGFGEGGVDDAEDADVLRHEYGHALHHDAVGGEVWGVDIRSIAEGICDYWASSLSDRTEPFHSYWVYNWDGHNEFWDGRFVTTEDVYPDDWSADLYRNGTIWAHALWSFSRDVNNADVADAIVAQSLYYMASGIDPEAAAQALLQAEDDLYGGQYRIDVVTALAEKGFMDAYGSMEGYIGNELTGNPVEGAQITVEGVSAFSEANGHYLLEQIPIGHWDAEFSAEGFRNTSRNVYIETEQTLQFSILLSPVIATVDVDSLNLHAYIGENADSSITLTSLNSDIYYIMRADPVGLDPIPPYEAHAAIPLNLPPEEMQDVVFVNGCYYVLHTAAQAVYSVYVLDQNGFPVRSFLQPTDLGIPFRGLTTDGEFLYSIVSSTIVKYDTLGVVHHQFEDVHPTYRWLAKTQFDGHFWCAREDGVIEPFGLGVGHYWEPIETGLPINGIAYDIGRGDLASVVLLTDPEGSAPEVHFFDTTHHTLVDEHYTLANEFGVPLGAAVFTGLQQPIDYRYLVTLMDEGAGQQLQLYRIRWTIPYISFDGLSGLVYENESDTVAVHAESQFLETGFYEAMLKIFFPHGGSALEVPFTLRITAVNAPQFANAGQPREFAVTAPSPNPCNAATVMTVTTPRAGEIKLKVYDILGRQVDHIRWQQDAGSRRITWTPAPGTASGLYLVRVQIEEYSPITRKIVVVK